VPYQEMPNLLANCLVALSTQNNINNRSETGLSPLKVFETMSCGRPVIVTDFPFMSDLVREHNCGLIIPHNDPEALAKAVRTIYNNPEYANAMGKNGRRAAVYSHSWEVRVIETYKIISRLIEQDSKK